MDVGTEKDGLFIIRTARVQRFCCGGAKSVPTSPRLELHPASNHLSEESSQAACIMVAWFQTALIGHQLLLC